MPASRIAPRAHSKSPSKDAQSANVPDVRRLVSRSEKWRASVSEPAHLTLDTLSPRDISQPFPSQVPQPRGGGAVRLLLSTARSLRSCLVPLF